MSDSPWENRNDVDRLLAMAEAYANSEPLNDLARHRKISRIDAEQLINGEYVDITMAWRMIMRVVDEGLAYAMTGVYVPKWMLGPDIADDQMFEVLSSSRMWFDETKLDEHETMLVYTAVNIAIRMMNRRNRDGTTN